MAHKKIMFRILLSSPSDLKDERIIISKVVEDLNMANKESPFGIELYKWESDVEPSLTMADGQKLIDETFDYQHSDLLIGLFYKKLGKGTVHEIEEAVKVKNKQGNPEIKLYFKEVNMLASGMSEEELNGYHELLKKKKEYHSLGLTADFADIKAFTNTIRNHLNRFFNRETQKFGRNTNNEQYIPSDCNPHINSYKLFYYRAAVQKMKIKQLSVVSGICESKLRKYEKVCYEKDDICFFPRCEIKDLKKIEDVLGIRRGDLIINGKEYQLIQEKAYYTKNKGLQKTLTIPKDGSIRYSAIVFDFDGTLVDAHSLKTTWEKIWTGLGYDISICQELHSQFDNKKINHQEWCDLTAEYFIKKGMRISDLNEVIKCMQLLKGTKEVLERLSKAGVKLYIVSGSIKEVILPVLGEYASYFEDISANSFVFSKDEKLREIVGTEFDFEGKAEYIKRLIDNNNIPPQKVLFVGNSFNDAHAYKSGARTLCVNPTKTNSHNRKYWHNCIDDMTDLTQILRYC